MIEQRFAICRPIHKAVHQILFSTSREISLTDLADDTVTRENVATIDRAIEFLREHREHEEAYVHAALESKVPGITAKFEEAHQEDDRLFAEIEKLEARIGTAAGGERIGLEVEVHERFNAYVGIYLGHLYREET